MSFCLVVNQAQQFPYRVFPFIFNERKIGFNQDFLSLSTAPTQAPQVTTRRKPGSLMSWFRAAALPEFRNALLDRGGATGKKIFLSLYFRASFSHLPTLYIPFISPPRPIQVHPVLPTCSISFSPFIYFPPISPSFQLFFGYFSLLPILFIPLLDTVNVAFVHFADLCEIRGCSAPYNIGCRVVDSRPQCICPTCPNIRRPVCASDDVQDLSECHLKQQACLGNISVTVVKQAQCGVFFYWFYCACSYLRTSSNH